MRIKIEYAGKDGWTRWIQPVRKGYKMQCCNCDLIHIVDFRIKLGRVQFKMKRSRKVRKGK